MARKRDAWAQPKNWRAVWREKEEQQLCDNRRARPRDEDQMVLKVLMNTHLERADVTTFNRHVTTIMATLQLAAGEADEVERDLVEGGQQVKLTRHVAAKNRGHRNGSRLPHAGPSVHTQ